MMIRPGDVNEAVVVDRTGLPLTRASLGVELRRVGLEPGLTVLVHSSLKALGWVVGGPVAIVGALLEALTPTGTLAMPAFSGEYSDPSGWRDPAVPSAWWPIIREHMPAFDPGITPSRKVGAVAEVFRTWPGTLRSSHPQVSFAAWGRQAGLVVREHPLDFPLGPRSPLGRLYDLDARVLLLGVGYDRNTAFHLAEYGLPGRAEEENGAPVLEDGVRVWKTYRDVVSDPGLFPAVGAALEAAGSVTFGRAGQADCRFFRLRAAVDLAAAFLGRAPR